MRRRNRLEGRPSPAVVALPPRVLVRAAWMLGRGFPDADVAERLRCCPRRLGTELNRLGVDRVPAPRGGGPDTLDLSVKLTRDERTTVGTAAIEHHLYPSAVLMVLLHAVLRQGRPAVDRLLKEGGAR